MGGRGMIHERFEGASKEIPGAKTALIALAEALRRDI